MNIKLGIIGVGFVGSAMLKSFKSKNINVKAYDKYKELDNFISCLETDIIFLCLPTEFDYEEKEFNKSIIYDICQEIQNNNYKGLIVLKSTVEPLSTKELSEKFTSLNFVYNPEFLSQDTAFVDFHNQSHIVLGNQNATDIQLKKIVDFYQNFYPNSKISVCEAVEAESMKIFCNSFYAVKIQFFNELFLLCQINNCKYDNVLKLMLNNNWINPMHTKVPGKDNKLSYGGNCFPKDTNALFQHMKNKKTLCKILGACIEERNSLREKKK